MASARCGQIGSLPYLRGHVRRTRHLATFQSHPVIDLESIEIRGARPGCFHSSLAKFPACHQWNHSNPRSLPAPPATAGSSRRARSPARCHPTGTLGRPGSCRTDRPARAIRSASRDSLTAELSSPPWPAQRPICSARQSPVLPRLPHFSGRPHPGHRSHRASSHPPRPGRPVSWAKAQVEIPSPTMRASVIATAEPNTSLLRTANLRSL